MRLFVFYEACSPLPMGEGPGVRSGFGLGFFCVWSGLFVGRSKEARRIRLWADSRARWAYLPEADSPRRKITGEDVFKMWIFSRETAYNMRHSNSG